MKIVHHETVTHLVHDPNSNTGLKEITERRLSNTSTIAFPSPTDDEPQVFSRGDDGTFDVPEEVGNHFVKGTHGSGFPGWSIWTGDPDGPAPAASPDRLAELERRLEEMAANSVDPAELDAAKAKADAAEARAADLEAQLAQAASARSSGDASSGPTPGASNGPAPGQ